MTTVDVVLTVVLIALIVRSWFDASAVQRCLARLDELEHEVRWRRVTGTIKGPLPATSCDASPKEP